MHLILGILKITGIILLILIGLLVLAVLSLLFVPLRYELSGKKMPDVLEGRVKISWLFHILSVFVEYKGQALKTGFRILGFTVKTFGGSGPKNSAGAGAGRRKPGKKPKKRTEKEEPASLPPSDSREEQGNKEIQPELREEKLFSEELPEEISEDFTEERSGEDFRSEKEDPEGFSSGGDKAGPVGAVRRIGSRVKKAWERFRRTVSSIWEFFLFLPERLLDWFLSGQNRLEWLEKSRDRIIRKVRPFLKDSSRKLYKRLLGHLRYLWEGYRPRKIRGWIRFGTGAPDVTGQLTGLIYLLLPASSEGFEIMPEFTETVIEADITLKGHIRACRMAKVAICLWRDRELRKMIRRIKGGKSNGR